MHKIDGFCAETEKEGAKRKENSEIGEVSDKYGSHKALHNGQNGKEVEIKDELQKRKGENRLVNAGRGMKDPETEERAILVESRDSRALSASRLAKVSWSAGRVECPSPLQPARSACLPMRARPDSSPEGHSHIVVWLKEEYEQTEPDV